MCDKRGTSHIGLTDPHRVTKAFRCDPCMGILLQNINRHIETIAHCCGHGKYAMTIICRDKDGKAFDLCSNIWMQRKILFYKRDAAGIFYIPEVHGG